MAQVSSEYSKQAQILKHDLMTPKVRGSSILEIKAQIEALWKGILPELEIEAYRTIDAQFSDWSWGFKKEWEKTAQRKLMHCTDEELRVVYDELTSSLKDVCKV